MRRVNTGGHGQSWIGKMAAKLRQLITLDARSLGINSVSDSGRVRDRERERETAAECQTYDQYFLSHIIPILAQPIDYIYIY